MKLWIRVDASAPRDPAIARIAGELGVRAAEALGLCAAVWCAMSEHAVRGDIAEVPDRTLESWAQWEGRRGRFAPIFRKIFAPAGVVHGWTDRQGALLTRMERDRLRHRKDTETPRKFRGNSVEPSTEVRKKHRGKSTSTVRNVTEQPNPTTPVVAAAPHNGAGGGWVAEVVSDWEELRDGASISHGHAGKALKPLIERHTWPVVRPAWRRFAESPEARFGAEYFARNYPDYTSDAPPRAGKPTAAEQSIRNTELALGVKLR